MSLRVVTSMFSGLLGGLFGGLLGGLLVLLGGRRGLLWRLRRGL